MNAFTSLILALAARATVHFQSVTDKLSPHDAVFSISEAGELKDTSLSAACRLHAASGSTSSSSSSVRRRRLGEITEDAEDVRALNDESEKPLPPLPSEQRQMKGRAASILSGADTNSVHPTNEAQDLVQSRPTSSKGHDREQSTSATIVPLILSHSLSTTPGYPHSVSSRPDQDGITARSNGPTSRDPYNMSLYDITPKVKLGPRPSVHSDRRPYKSGPFSRQSERRPVSSLPAGVRMAQRKSQSASIISRPQPQQSRFPISVPLPVRVLDNPDSIIPTPRRPLTSPSLPRPQSTSSSVSTVKLPARTPEKQKLMKALELRRRQMYMESQRTTEPHSGSEAKSSQISIAEIKNSEQHGLQHHENFVGPLTVEDGSGLGAKGYENQHIVLPREGDINGICEDETTNDSVPPQGQRDKMHISQDVPPRASLSEDHDGTTTTDPLVIAEQSVTQTDLPDNTSVAREFTSDDAASPPSNGPEEDLKVVVDSEANTEFTRARKDTSPLSSINSLEPASTLASSFSEETHHQTSGAMENGLLADAAHAAKAIVSNSEAPNNELSDKQSPTNRLETCDAILSDNGLIGDGISFDGKSVKTVSIAPGTSFRTYNEAMVGSAQSHISSAPSMDNPRLNIADFSEHGADINLTSVVQLSSIPIDQDNSASIEALPSGAQSDLISTERNGAHARSKEQRRVVISPIQTDINTDNSDDNLLSDDSLMDELNSATVQEAKPVSVGKSPLTSFSKTVNGYQSNSNLDRRAVSSPMPKQSQPSTVAILARGTERSKPGLLPLDSEEIQGTMATIKTVNVSSGISQRIKALERVSSQSSRLNSPPRSTPPKVISPSFSTMRKSSLQSASRPSPAKSQGQDEVASICAENTSSVAQPYESDDIGRSSLSRKNVAQQTEQSSDPVKGRILRDIKIFHAQAEQADQPANDLISLSLYQSCSVIDHQKTLSQTAPSMDDSIKPEGASSTATIAPPQTPSSSPVKDSRRPSLGSTRSTSSRDRVYTKSPPPSSDSSSSGMVNSEESRESKRDSKKGSRKSRIFRRMSSISNTSRRSLVHSLSPTVKEEDPGVTPPSTKVKRVSVDVGEINVQFPDNLVRRHHQHLAAHLPLMKALCKALEETTFKVGFSRLCYPNSIEDRRCK